MAGTAAGGLKAGETNKKKYGKDFYREIGAIGGRNGHTGGFAANPKLARLAGACGGRNSKRGKDPERALRVKRAKTLYKEGWTIEQLMNEFNITKSTVFTYLKEGE